MIKTLAHSTLFFAALQFIFIPIVLLWERYSPIDPNQGTIKNLQSDRTSLYTDVMFFLFALFEFIVIPAFGLGFLSIIYTYLKKAMSFHLLEQIPSELIRWIIVFLFIDFISWLRHFCIHYVGAFYCFHSLHHAPKKLNILTGFRSHPMAIWAKKFIGVIPLALIGASREQFFAFFVFREFWMLTHHANIDMKIGPFKYIMATSQFHWAHHWAKKQGRSGINYGSIFAIWDYLFGTGQYIEKEDLKDVKMGDSYFGDLNPTPLQAIVYPFKYLYKYYTLS